MILLSLLESLEVNLFIEFDSLSKIFIFPEALDYAECVSSKEESMTFGSNLLSSVVPYGLCIYNY